MKSDRFAFTKIQLIGYNIYIWGSFFGYPEFSPKTDCENATCYVLVMFNWEMPKLDLCIFLKNGNTCLEMVEIKIN